MSSTMSTKPSRLIANVQREHDKKRLTNKLVQTILIGTTQSSNPLSQLRGISPILESIRDFALPAIDYEERYSHQMRMELCPFDTEHVWVEQVQFKQEHFRNANVSKYDMDDVGSGSLMSKPLAGQQWFHTKPFMRQHAWDTNPDGTYLNEEQLRLLWKDFASPFCRSRECNSICCALPGDTVIHVDRDPYRHCVGYQPASMGELRDRGYLGVNGHKDYGFMAARAQLARDDPSQLESDDENE